MTKPRSTFRQRDVTAAVRAVQAAGLAVSRVEVGPDGRIIVILAERDPDGDARHRNEWDE